MGEEREEGEEGERRERERTEEGGKESRHKIELYVHVPMFG